MYREITNGNYGHMNYAVATWSFKLLKQVHTKYGTSWHTNLAQVAIEFNKLKCLKYIMGHMGDVNCGNSLLKMKNISQECKKYIEQICKNCNGRKLHPKVEKWFFINCYKYIITLCYTNFKNITFIWLI